jgi:hypothetical protein
MLMPVRITEQDMIEFEEGEHAEADVTAKTDKAWEDTEGTFKGEKLLES